MGAPLWKRALLVALLAYNWAGLRSALRARGNGFLSPPGVGPQLQGNRSVVQPHEPGPRLQFTADLHASSLMSSRSFLVRSLRCFSLSHGTCTHCLLPVTGAQLGEVQLEGVHAEPRGAWGRALSCPAHTHTRLLTRGSTPHRTCHAWWTAKWPSSSSAVRPRFPHCTDSCFVLLASTLTPCCSVPRVLAVFTSLPAPFSVLSATWETNAGALLSLLHGLPPWKVLSPAARLEHAFARTWAESAGSSGALQVLTSRDELELYVVQRSLCSATTGKGCRYAAAILGIEGVDALAGMGGGDAAAAADEVFERGVRAVALHHAADNAAGRSRHGAGGAGGEALTAWGAALVARLDTLGVVLDLSHSHDDLITSLLAANLTRRVVLTHVVPAAVAASCVASGGAMGRRPGSWGPPVAVVDETLLSAVAAGGGVIGVSFAACVGPESTAVGSWAADPVGGVAASVASLVALLGADHVALGSDWDGGVVLPTALDAAGMPALREALLAAGLTPEQEGLVTGGTALQLLRDTLPSDLEMAETAARGVASRRVSVLNDDGTTYDVWL